MRGITVLLENTVLITLDNENANGRTIISWNFQDNTIHLFPIEH